MVNFFVLYESVYEYCGIAYYGRAVPCEYTGHCEYVTFCKFTTINPFQSNFSAPRILPSSYLFWVGRCLVGLWVCGGGFL
jgi:hypothetical protein